MEYTQQDSKGFNIDMDVVIKSFNPQGNIVVPSSKSYAHRVFIMAFITKKTITFKDIDLSEDLIATLNGLKALGAVIKINENSVEFVEYRDISYPVVIDVKESASSLRFLIPLALYLTKDVTFIGKKTLFSRPLDEYIEVFKSANISVNLDETSLNLKGELSQCDFYLNGSVSSQFVTGLMFLIHFNNTIKIKLLSRPVSKAYIDITIDVMEKFGYYIGVKNNEYYLNDVKKSTVDIIIEKDYSQFAFFAVLSAIKGGIKCLNMNPKSKQGDRQIINILKEFGADIRIENDEISINKTHIFGNHQIDLNDIIDLGPILFVLASFNEGITKFINYQRLKIKESNRLQVMKEELLKVGIDIQEKDNELIIVGKKSYKGNYIFNSHGDHRIAMSLMVLSTCIEGISIVKEVECINKSYPMFVKDLFSLKID